MSENLKHNILNLVVSCLALITAYHLGFGGLLYWFGGLLIFPAIILWFQFKYSFGSFIQRLVTALVPWLVLCCIGLIWASKTEHVGMRTMNMLFFEMPLYSILIGSITIAFWWLIKVTKNRSK